MKRGFTIVEVLVVIGIIAVLTALIFPSINDIRAKNRDAEKVADIAAIQLGLSLYYSQHQTKGYPEEIFNNADFSPKYVPAESLISPNADSYIYVPLKKEAAVGDKCTYYHLGVKLELPSAQIDATDKFSSANNDISNGYVYCGDYGNDGENGIDTKNIENMYQVHP